MDKKLDVKIENIQRDCDHKGKWLAAGNVAIPARMSVQIVTTLFCGKCGSMMYASQDVGLSEKQSNLAIPKN